MSIYKPSGSISVWATNALIEFRNPAKPASGDQSSCLEVGCKRFAVEVAIVPLALFSLIEGVVRLALGLIALPFAVLEIVIPYPECLSAMVGAGLDCGEGGIATLKNVINLGELFGRNMTDKAIEFEKLCYGF